MHQTYISLVYPQRTNPRQLHNDIDGGDKPNYEYQDAASTRVSSEYEYQHAVSARTSAYEYQDAVSAHGMVQPNAGRPSYLEPGLPGQFTAAGTVDMRPL